MSRARTIGTAPAASPILHSATVGGSTALSASLAPQTTLAALTLAATSESVTGTPTRQWAIYASDGTDLTGTLITAGATTASPTWAAFTASDAYRITYTLSDDGGTAVYTRTVQIGDSEKFLDAWQHIYDTDGAYNWGSGAQSLDGVLHTPAVPAGSTLNTTPGTGIVAVRTTGDCNLRLSVTQAVGGYTRDDVVRVWVRWNNDAFTVDGQSCGLGPITTSGSQWCLAWSERISGSAGVKTARAGSGVQDTTGTGQWVVACCEIRGHEVAWYYSTAAWAGSWPAVASMTRLTVNSKGWVTGYDAGPTAADGFDPASTDCRILEARQAAFTARLVQTRVQIRRAA